MTTPQEVVSRFQSELSQATFDELIPYINSGAIDLDHLRRHYMSVDFWRRMKSNGGNTGQALLQVAIDYDCSPNTVRYNMNR